MSADLRAPVEAAAVYQFGIDAALLGIDHERLGQAWDDAKPAVKHAYRESVLGAVAGAAPLIEAQVRARIAAKIEVRATQLRDRSEEHAAAGRESVAEHFRHDSDALYGAACIARGDS